MNKNPIRNRFGDKQWETIIALSLFLLASVRLPAELSRSETNVTSQQLSAMAEAREKSGDLLEAAKVYERLIEKYPAKRMVLAQRLVQIYAKEGLAEKALSWAHVVMERNPEPQAYLAGVYMMLGKLDEAKDILEKLVAERKEPRQKLALCWQLAEVYEKRGDIPAAEKTLLESVESAAGSVDEDTAWSHVCRFYKNHGLLETRVKDWEKAVAENPGDEKARRALAAATALTRP
jgi:tetratricopeptide (TPR) repeat protein